jgi:Domain of unknown function (DUF4082)
MNILGNISPTTFGNDGSNYNLGMVFKTTSVVNLDGIRFYKPSGDSGTHYAKLYDYGSQTILKSAQFTNESSSGWQEVLFNSPMLSVINTLYMVVVNTANFIYPYQQYFFENDFISGKATAIAGNNNLFSAFDLFPSTSFRSSCYFRDIIFSDYNPNPNPIIPNEYINVSNLIDMDKISFISNISEKLKKDYAAKYKDFSFKYEYDFDSGVNKGVINSVVVGKKQNQFLNGLFKLDGSQKLSG